MDHPGATHGSPRLDYCSISWEQILSWTEDGIEFTRQDRIAMAVVTLAFTTIRRIGSFLPKNVKESETFSWILPQFMRPSIEGTTLLVWIPRVKTDPEGRGTVLILKITGNAGCPISFMQPLAREKS